MFKKLCAIALLLFATGCGSQQKTWPQMVEKHPEWRGLSPEFQHPWPPSSHPNPEWKGTIPKCEQRFQHSCGAGKCG